MTKIASHHPKQSGPLEKEKAKNVRVLPLMNINEEQQNQAIENLKDFSLRLTVTSTETRDTKSEENNEQRPVAATVKERKKMKIFYTFREIAAIAKKRKEQ